MAHFRKITARDKPETIARTAALHEQHLRTALSIAFRRAGRSHPLVRQLLSRATVEGKASRLNLKAAAVSFMVPQFGQSWHEIIPWQDLTGCTPAETATSIAWSLRENIRRNQRKPYTSAPDA